MVVIMSRRWITTVIAVCLSAYGISAAEQCLVPSAQDNRRLIEYVQAKYRLPASSHLEVRETGFITNTCYRNVQLTSVDPAHPFHLEVIASPDFRFLSREFMDTNTDPAKEERERQQTLSARLLHGNFHSAGPNDAPLNLTVFADFQCPYCAQMATALKRDILPAASGKARLVFRNFPLPMHQWAKTAAESAACAGRQNDRFFWTVHDFLFEHQREIQSESMQSRLHDYLGTLGDFDLKSFDACATEQQTASEIEADVRLGQEVGVRGTPTIFVNGQQINGYHPDQILSLIRQLTETKGASQLAR